MGKSARWPWSPSGLFMMIGGGGLVAGTIRPWASILVPGKPQPVLIDGTAHSFAGGETVLWIGCGVALFGAVVVFLRPRILALLAGSATVIAAGIAIENVARSRGRLVLHYPTGSDVRVGIGLWICLAAVVVGVAASAVAATTPTRHGGVRTASAGVPQIGRVAPTPLAPLRSSPEVAPAPRPRGSPFKRYTAVAPDAGQPRSPDRPYDPFAADRGRSRVIGASAAQAPEAAQAGEAVATATEVSPLGGIAPGWYPDPAGTLRWRWFDGSSWSGWVNDGVATIWSPPST